tara:strand:- start:8107 stop:8895 length:789 start_codon:yes stop_codon:yes gene_type:complete
MEHKMNILTFIEDLTLNESENVRVNCPSCGGRRTLTAIKMDGTIIFNCYRVSCNIKGAVKAGYTRQDLEFILKKRSPSDLENKSDIFMYPEYVSYDIDNSLMDAFITEWGLDEVSLSYDVKDKRAVFPIRNDSGILIDAIGRTLNNGYPKWLRYGSNADYYISRKDNSNVVVVEDILSAIIISKICNVNGMALLGTNLSEKTKYKLKEYKKVLIALDPDAKKKTIKYTKELKSEHPCVFAVSLKDDLKYKVEEDIIKVSHLL